MKVFLVAVLLLGTLQTALCMAPLSFSPTFPVIQYETNESQTLMVHLSAPILTDLTFPSFNGSIEVVVITENSTSDQRAELGSDYTVNKSCIEDGQSSKFTVTFQWNQSESSQCCIQINDDLILEGREYFRLRINEVRFIGNASTLYKAQDGVENTSVDVSIEDNDSVQVKWTTSQLISVTEGVDHEVKLCAEVIGVYAIPIAIGVQCFRVVVTDTKSADPSTDFNFTAGTELMFEDVGTNRSYSQVVVPIIDDDIAEPRKFFLCTLQGNTVNPVQPVHPTQVTIKIFDDDELIVQWGKDFYECNESDLVVEVELVMINDPKLEVDKSDAISIRGFPQRIPKANSNCTKPGPDIPGCAVMEQFEYNRTAYGIAQVRHLKTGRTDVPSKRYAFTFTPSMKSALINFTIIDDDILERDKLFIGKFDISSVLSSNWNISIGTPSVFYCLIRDDDSVNVTFREEDYTVNECDGQVHVSLLITGRFFIRVHATIEVSGGTAKDPEDYSGAKYYNVTFPQSVARDLDNPKFTSISIPVSINITDDDILEDVEYFWVKIVSTSHLRVNFDQHNTINVTIIDDDTVVVNFLETGFTVNESDGHVVINVSLRITGRFSIPIDATIKVNGVTATDPEDYTAPRFYNVTFPASVALDHDIPEISTMSLPISVNIEDDNSTEDVEYFQVLIVEPNNVRVNIGPNNTINVTINDDDSPITPTLLVAPDWVIPVTTPLLLLLFGLLCLFLMCLYLYCCKRRRDPKGVYNVVKREKLFQADRALLAEQFATLDS